MKQIKMSLKGVLKGIKILKNTVPYKTKIKGIASDSRKVKEGYVFVAIKGEKRNGNDYIEEAIKNGAVAIITEEYADVSPKICVDDARKSLSLLWRNFYKNPAKRMKVIAITGTNGKTSTAYLLHSILNKAQKRVGLISTISIEINCVKVESNGGSEVLDIPSAMTTPDPEILYKNIYNMKKSGIKYLIMESSSHGIAQKKLYGIKPYICAFTNLSKEHLDFHKNMREYYLTKRQLLLASKYKIVNIDDEYGKEFYSENLSAKSISISKNADFRCKKTTKTDTGSNYLIEYCKKQLVVESKLIGDFNAYNILMAFACSKILKIKDKFIAEGIKFCEKIKGRMERYKDKDIFIDFAHTPFAMENILRTVRQQFPSKHIKLLFGCGGDRDRSKRKEMGRIASLYSDELIITSDNSRSEDPKKIIDEILTGVNEKIKKTIIVDRKEAIIFAVRDMSQNEILLLLGKGHETYEINKLGKTHFDEREIMDEALNASDTY